MRVTNVIRLLCVGVAAGWIVLFVEAAELIPWRPQLAVHIALVGFLIASTIAVAVVGVVAYLFRGGPLLYQMMQLGRATQAEDQRIRVGA